MTAQLPPTAESIRPTNYSDESKYTIYVLVRTDIPLHHQVVQSNHASAEAGRSAYNELHGIASLVLLMVPDKEALMAAREALARKGVRTELFYEPDFDIGHSALATEPLLKAQRKYLRGLPLWKPPLLAEDIEPLALAA